MIAAILFVGIGLVCGLLIRFPLFALVAIVLATGYCVVGAHTRSLVLEFLIALGSLQVGYFLTVVGRLVLPKRPTRRDND